MVVHVTMTLQYFLNGIEKKNDELIINECLLLITVDAIS